jgi:hypothetical protein
MGEYPNQHSPTHFTTIKETGEISIKTILHIVSIVCVCVIWVNEINDSYEDDHDKHEPWLLLCDYCVKEYGIPSYPN